jgi:hypothetical protein
MFYSSGYDWLPSGRLGLIPCWGREFFFATKSESLLSPYPVGTKNSFLDTKTVGRWGWPLLHVVRRLRLVWVSVLTGYQTLRVWTPEGTRTFSLFKNQIILLSNGSQGAVCISQNGWGVKVTTHFHLILKLRIVNLYIYPWYVFTARCLTDYAQGQFYLWIPAPCAIYDVTPSTQTQWECSFTILQINGPCVLNYVVI